MTTVQASANVSEAEVSVVITRADGTTEDLGVVAYYNKSPHKRLIWAIKKRLKSLN